MDHLRAEALGQGCDQVCLAVGGQPEQESAQRLAMPEIPESLFIESIERIGRRDLFTAGVIAKAGCRHGFSLFDAAIPDCGSYPGGS